MSGTVDPQTARRTWRRLEPIHAMVYFASEPAEHYAAAGLRGGRMGYFASRAAAMGAVPAEVVIATFFNFSPDVVRRSIPLAWSLAAPDRVLDARLAGADAALARLLGSDRIHSAEVAEAAELARRAALAACEHLEGRPLFAAHAALPWPGEPHLVLFHAQTLLRELRGDAHVAALLLDGFSGIEALVLHEATGETVPGVLQATRAWDDAAWTAAVDGLTERGLVTRLEDGGLRLTDTGRGRREEVEARTDLATVTAYGELGDDGAARLGEIGRQLSRTIVDAGVFAAPPPSALE